MSSVIEVDQIHGSGHNNQLAITSNCRDDVFSGTQDNDHQVVDLSNKFEQLQAVEKSSQPVTDLYLSLNNAKNCVSAVRPNYDVIRQPNQCMFMGGISTIHTETEQRSEDNQIIKTNVTAMYACRTASDTLLEGIRTSVRNLISNVPKIVINGTPERSLVPVSTPNESEEHNMGAKIWFGSHGVYSGGKYSDRHRSRTYYRPYCLISRRHYSCQPLSIRRRRYGVSQKGSAEHSVNELTQLLSKLGTADTDQQKLFDLNKKGKWQYSPPPKYYMIRYRPSAKLAKIKERSRSLNDLSLQNLQIHGSEHEKSQDNNRKISADAQTGDPPQGALSGLQTSVNFMKGGASGSQICQMVSGIGKLSMIDQ